jgi:hypothetical protein
MRGENVLQTSDLMMRILLERRHVVCEKTGGAGVFARYEGW